MSLERTLPKSNHEQRDYIVTLNLRQAVDCTRQIVDLGSLQSLTGLTSLSLSDNRIVDVGPLANMTDLLALDLSNNQISDIGSLGEQEWLWTLALAHNGLTDISPLAEFGNLSSLSLANNEIHDIGAILEMSLLPDFQANLNDNPLGCEAVTRVIPLLARYWILWNRCDCETEPQCVPEPSASTLQCAALAALLALGRSRILRREVLG